MCTIWLNDKVTNHSQPHEDTWPAQSSLVPLVCLLSSAACHVFFSSDVKKLKYFQPSAHFIVMIILIIACNVWLRTLPRSKRAPTLFRGIFVGRNWCVILASNCILYIVHIYSINMQAVSTFFFFLLSYTLLSCLLYKKITIFHTVISGFWG